LFLNKNKMESFLFYAMKDIMIFGGAEKFSK